MKTKEQPRTRGKYRPIMLVNIYRFAKLGMSEPAICEAIHVPIRTFSMWKHSHPDIVKAISMGRREGNETWQSFIYDRLPVEIRQLWDQIEKWDDDPNAMVKIETLLADHGRKARQQLFLYALIHTNFSQSRALAKVNIPRATLNDWIANDPQFAGLVDEIEWHKGNFFEESLVQLVANRDTAATIFANRTFNKGRGYAVADKVQHEHSGTIEHTLDLSELELTLEVRQAIMDAIRHRDERIQIEKVKAALPVEYRVLEDLSEEIASVQ